MKIARKNLFIILFSIFSTLVFAAPGGGGRGGGPGGGPGGGNRGGGPSPAGRSSGPGSASNPSFSSHSQPGSSKSSGSRSFLSNPSNSRGGASNPAENGPNPSSLPQPGNPASAPSPSKNPGANDVVASNRDTGDFFANGMNFPEISPKSEGVGAIVYYRGNRVLAENSEFTLQNVKSERLNSNEVTLEITFNQTVNPLTFTTDSILVDGEAISSKTKFSFNKKGDTIKLAVPAQNEDFSLTIKDVESYDGTVIEPTVLSLSGLNR